MSSGIGDIKGIGGVPDNSGFNNVVDELSSLIGCKDKGIKINIETGKSSDCSLDAPAISNIMKRIDTLR